MNGGRLNPGSFPRRGQGAWPVVALFLSALLACGGDRGSRSPATGEGGQTPPASDSMTSSSNDTTASPKPDTAAASSVRPDSAATSPKPATGMVHQAPPKKPSQTAAAAKRAAAKPTASASKPAAQPSTDSATATGTPPAAQAATPSQASDSNAPLRDAYHTAPLDTVPQLVYEGWKQFNLNCARCHGEDVMGTTIAPHLIVSLRGPINTKELFVQTVCAGRPAKGMPSWCALGLGMDKIDAIYSYVKGRSDSKIHPGRPAVKPAG